MSQASAQGRSNELLAQTSFLYGGNAAFIEELYERYLEDPDSVGPDWRALFDELGDRNEGGPRGPSWKANGLPRDDSEMTQALGGSFPREEGQKAERAPQKPAAPKTNGAAPHSSVDEAQVRQSTLDSIRAIMLIRAYRVLGHRAANLDPLELSPRAEMRELDPATYGFGPGDMDRPIYLDMVLGLEFATLRQIVEICRKTYCGPIGYEFMHITDPEQKQWIQARVEGAEKDIVFTPEGKRAILNKLAEAEGFEKFCHVKFTGTKRFGLDGAEAVIPALEQIIKRGGALGARELCFGMAHRGRLNVLANVMQKPYRAIFHEFQGGSSSPSDVQGSGDVKYHLGASSDRAFDGNDVHLSLSPNPSHLEIVDPVVLGKCRVKQVQQGNGDIEVGRERVIPVLLHGDAAFAGQGVVAECFAMSGTRGYRTGGTIHIIINNQIGFTTSPHHARSSPYPSDVALMVQAPILHVNGDDPEAVVHCAKVATEFRQRFRQDVVIDMFCYRRFGHNEGDEPAFTQPLMYQKIRAHPSTLTLYSERLVKEGLLTEEDVSKLTADFSARLDAELDSAKTYKSNKADWFDGVWAGLGLPQDEDRRGETGVPLETLREIGTALSTVPNEVKVHRTIQRLLGQKAEMFRSGEGIDWATAEALAFGSLALEGFRVRLSGQDSARGTFSQRHAALVDQETEERYIPLNNIRPGAQADFEVIDSLLSEAAVLGFEYGYSSAEPRSLVLWEAQFGDFANGAQVVIDQFIASGERKWLRANGLVMLLPHGFEGQGPEHSSARLERFLQLCAEDNMQVANCTTPANYFHILRRQLHRNFRKPLVIMTPKSLLRHKRAVSRLDEMGSGSSFHRVLHDDAESNPASVTVKLVPDEKIRRVVLCSGKVYYDLLEDRDRRGTDSIYILRVEQFYPFPAKSLLQEVGRFPNAEIVWCQEEPKNMGGWTFMSPNLEWLLQRLNNKQKQPRYAGRPAAASPAAGLMSDHQKQLAAFLEEALAL
ncbi:MAG: 2-oxoglutarate dehydrogenase E1 component [Alphaproteobacteria bacterium]|nr:2-oxoglutarate dehydrogenase E1 component [Alphaproteobacteria bacterium]